MHQQKAQLQLMICDYFKFTQNNICCYLLKELLIDVL